MQKPIKETFACDKRCAAGLMYEEQCIAMGGDLFGHDGGDGILPVMLRDPNLTALMLNISHSAFARAKDLFNNELLPSIQIVKDTTGNSSFWYLPDKEEQSFDLIEQLFIAVLFAYSAVECFVNNCIPESFETIRVDIRNGAKAKLIVGKDWITRNDKLDYKIKKILPEIYQFKFESRNLTFWKDFNKLKNLRDNIAHPKTIKGSQHPTQIKFLAEIFHPIMNDKILDSASKIVEYLSERIQNAPKGVMRSPFIPLEFCHSTPELQDYYAFTNFSIPEETLEFLKNARKPD
jgi:hypothetical protein